MTTKIIFNGSKWAGEAPDSVEKLLEVLARETLDPKFERYGDFGPRVDDAHADEYGIDKRAGMHFHGNFLTVSHAFSVVTDDSAVIADLIRAIKANKETDAYKLARIEDRADAAKKKALFEQAKARHERRSR